MAHSLAGALQQAGGVRQPCPMKKSYVDVRRKDIDVAKGRIAETGDGASVVQDFADLVPLWTLAVANVYRKSKRDLPTAEPSR